MVSDQYPEIQTHEYLSVESTNAILLDEAQCGDRSNKLIYAELQTSGRGRRGRKWIQPCATGIQFSIRYTFDGGFNVIGGLSLAVGLWVANACEKLGAELKLKWPNDIYLKDLKAGGILVEIDGDINGPVTAVIGVGLNLYATPALDVEVACLNALDKDELFVSMVANIIAGLQSFESRGFAFYFKEWNKRALWRGEEVYTIGLNREIKGCLKGVTSSGELIVIADGVESIVMGGEISLRAKNNDKN